jgi:REP element-mobilizing transposase RayT
MLVKTLFQFRKKTEDKRDVSGFVRLWHFLLVARFARITALDTSHHVTQRGNAPQFILTTDAEPLVYLDLLRHYCTLHRLSLVGYCLMSNHVHLIVIPKQLDSLAATLKNTHGRYAAYWNAQHKSSGHVWQGRFYSCPLARWAGLIWLIWGRRLRYTELNPARAGPARAGQRRECSLRRFPIRGPALLFIPGRRRQTYRWRRDFASSPGQPGIGGAISRREPRQPRPKPFARAPIPDGRSAHRN